VAIVALGPAAGGLFRVHPLRPVYEAKNVPLAHSSNMLFLLNLNRIKFQNDYRLLQLCNVWTHRPKKTCLKPFIDAPLLFIANLQG
jgi:hypothetical protein